MNTILTVFKKEIKDSLRDKRTLLTAIVIPALIMPVLFGILGKVQKSIIEKEESKTLKIALIGANPNLKESLKDSSFSFLENYTIATGKEAITADSLDAIIAFNNNFSATIDSLKTADVNLYYKSTNLIFNSKISQKIELLKEQILQQRLAKLNLTGSIIKPLNVVNNDVATAKEQLGNVIGGFLPYIFIIFTFMGCMYPAIDLITGEKERGTMETLLSSSASRFQILIGKTIAIASIGLCSGIMTILGLGVGTKLIGGADSEIVKTILSMVNTKFILMLFAMLIPLSVFFAGLLSSLVIKSKSFKEAQSTVTPLTFVIIIPAIIATLPGIELNWQTACVPILNISLATKAIISGTINMAQYALIVASLFVLAYVAVSFSYKQFSNEKMVVK